MVNKMGFELSDKTIELFNNLAKGLTESLAEQAAKEQNEFQESFRAVAEMSKILYDECIKQGFSENEAIKFSASYLGNLVK